MLTQQEIRFLTSIKDNEALQNVSYLINALLTGVDLRADQIDQVLDHCNDLRHDSASEGTPLPPFVETLWALFTKLATGGNTSQDILSKQNQNDPFYQPLQQPAQQQEYKRKKEPKTKDPNTVKVPKVKENPLTKYANTEIDAENIPQYLLEISQIIDKIVAAKCEDIVKENTELKAQLAKIQALIGGK